MVKSSRKRTGSFYLAHIFLLIGLLTIPLKAQNTQRIFINEVLASNLGTSPDMVDFDDFSDWIELYNNDTGQINLDGYYLSDDSLDIKNIGIFFEKKSPDENQVAIKPMIINN